MQARFMRFAKCGKFKEPNFFTGVFFLLGKVLQYQEGKTQSGLVIRIN